MGFNSRMRTLLVKVAPVLALAIAAIACATPARPAHAVCTHASIVTAQLPGADAAQLEARTSSGSRADAPSQNATEPAADPDQDSMGSEREIPDALPAID